MSEGIKTAIILDPMAGGGWTAEEEFQYHVDRVNKDLAPRFLDAYSAHSTLQIKDGTELVLFDYGGMLPGCDGLVRSQCESIVEWAKEHPSALVIVISSFTYQMHIDPLLDRDEQVANLLLDTFALGERSMFPDWWLESIEEEKQ